MKQVERIFVTKSSAGIIMLTINTVDKWVHQHRYSDTEYIIGGDPDSTQDQLEYQVKITDEQLGKEKGVMYYPSVLQNKDQITYLYTPYNLIRKDRQFTEIYDKSTEQ